MGYYLHESFNGVQGQSRGCVQILKSRKKQVKFGQAEITSLVGASDPEPRARGVCSRGSMELWKVGYQSLIKIAPVFWTIMWVTVSKTQRER